MTTAIRVHDVGKCYRLGVTHAGSVRELANRLAGGLVRRFRPSSSRDESGDGQTRGPQHFWALRHVSFDVPRGEVVGIIGRNGAGKSTLLKLLSRISKPTEGRIELHGRVASLLEVGTGFHPELTGRENVFLNGTILGLTQREVARRYDEIVDFSGVDRFIDTPVKRYSSGMKVRLAFAVAAHLDPEILIVDEVLAVGDIEFQRRCLGKMNEVAHAGKTVLFVSHNMSAVRTLTTTGVLLSGGELVAKGPVREVIAEYMQDDESVLRSEMTYEPDEATTGDATLRVVRLLDMAEQPRASFHNDEQVLVEIEFNCAVAAVLQVGLEVSDQNGTSLFRTFSDDVADVWMNASGKGPVYRARCEIPAGLLNAGQYRVRTLLRTEHAAAPVTPERSPFFQVLFDVPNEGITVQSRQGLVAPILPWQINPHSAASPLRVSTT